MQSESEWQAKMKQWIALEKQRTFHFQTLQQIRKQQDALEAGLLHAVPIHERKHWRINPSSGGTIRFRHEREYAGISHKFLRQTLHEYEKDALHKWTSEDVFQYILSKRPYKDVWKVEWNKI